MTERITNLLTNSLKVKDGNITAIEGYEKAAQDHFENWYIAFRDTQLNNWERTMKNLYYFNDPNDLIWSKK